MKNLFAFITVAALLALAIPAQAQSYGPVTLATGGTIAVSTFNTYNRMFKLTDSPVKTVAIQTTFNFASASTANVTVNLDTSLDNVNWVTNAISWTIPGTGVNPASFITNVPFGAIGYGRLSTVANASATVVVNNLVVKASFKN